MKNDTVDKVLDFEMIHWADDGLFIAHKANKITYRKNGEQHILKIPTDGLGWKKIFMPIRKARRALRLDKTIVIPCNCGFVAVRNSRIYVYDDFSNKWTQADTRLNCRNPMYNAILNVDGILYIGEYGNPNGIGKRVLMSRDNGFTWTCVYQFKPDEIRHIHALLWDEYERKIWIFTGDFNSEPQVFKADQSFSRIERVGGGTQHWRACHAIFSRDYVDWMMDSPLEEVHHIRYDRENGSISIGQSFPGPVWYARIYGSVAYAATAQEVGPSHVDKKLHLYKSEDFQHWTEIGTFKHDGWPKGYFRYGVMTAVKGQKPIFSCEGVNHYDGKSILIKT